jgi:hypothetical protein
MRFEMNEATAYKWARQALRPLENEKSVEAHKYQQAADLVAKAILEAFKARRSHGYK